MLLSKPLSMKGTKFCTKCGVEKDLEEFKKSPRSRDGRYSHCKACETAYRATRTTETKAYLRQYYDQNKPHLAAYMARYHQDHKSARNAYNKTYYQAKRMNHLEHDILYRCRSRAKRLRIAFNLTLEDIVIPVVCPVLGIPIDRAGTGQKGGRPNSPSLDRIDPQAAGYTKGNVRIISNRANTLKCDASIAELELVIADLKSLNQRPSNYTQGKDDS